MNRARELCQGTSWKIPNDHELAPDIGLVVVEKLQKARWSEDDIGLMAEAFNELLTNAMIHGNLGLRKNPGEPTQKFLQRIKDAERSIGKSTSVHITFDLGVDSVTIVVMDEGPGFDVSSSVTSDPSREPVSMAEMGRGVSFTKMYFDSIVYNGKGNQVTVMKRKLSTKDLLSAE